METKDTILKKTFQLLLIKGYDGVSISDIQKATGMSRGILYHYFGNKEALFVEVTRKYFMSLFYIDLQAVSRFDVEAMIKYLEVKHNDIFIASLEDLGLESNVSIMNYDFLFYRVMQEDKEFAKEYLRAKEWEIKAWEIVLANEEREGTLKEGLRLDEVARYFIYLMDGIWMNAVCKGDAVEFVREMGRVARDFYALVKR